MTEFQKFTFSTITVYPLLQVPVNDSESVKRLILSAVVAGSVQFVFKVLEFFLKNYKEKKDGSKKGS